MALSVLKSPRKLQRRKTGSYSSCLLYDDIIKDKLQGIILAECNPAVENVTASDLHTPDQEHHQHHHYHHHHHHHHQPHIPEKMFCNCCAVEFSCRQDQRDHYKSDWHRYNLKLKLKSLRSVSEEDFEQIAGDVSSISGSEEDSDSDTESDCSVSGVRHRTRLLPFPDHVCSSSSHSGTDSETESWDGNVRKYPKVYFTNIVGEMLSVYRCLLYHKKKPPISQTAMLDTVMALPKQEKWLILMTAGGHFAGAVFDCGVMVAHKTFHRYVVRAKRGTAQGSRDSQGNAPKSAGASLRRYNEAALAQEVQELMVSWSDFIKKCDLIFLRAPSFNRHMFYGGKNPFFSKCDTRIRTIPFATRRPTLNEVKRVYHMLASVEFYGNASDIQDFIPASPFRRFSKETGKLEIISDDKVTRTPWRSRDKIKTPPLSASPKRLPPENSSLKNTEDFVKAIPDYVIREVTQRSPSTSASETELVELVETISTQHLQDFEATKKTRKKKSKRKRHSSKHQLEPDGDVFAEEKYHLRNSLYTACKTGDAESLTSLLAVFRVMSGSTDSTNHEDIAHNAVSTSVNEESEDKTDLNAASTSVNEESEDKTDLNATSCSVNEKLSSAEACTDGNSSVMESSTVCPEALVTETCENSNLGENDQIPEENTSSVSAAVSAVSQEDNLKFNSSPRKPSLLSNSPLRCKSEERFLSELSPLMAADILNEPFGDNETTLLHVSSKQGHSPLISLLLDAGADPSVRDKSGKVPYVIASNKETRKEFRRFMATHPDRYDYTKAQVPSPLTPEMEAEKKQKDLEKKKLQKKLKNERTKDKKEEMAKQKQEDAERKRFLSLSDREKRALAADKRLVQQLESKGETVPVLSRCWQCGNDLTGKIPFEYCEYKFCSTKCLQSHRKQGKS